MNNIAIITARGGSKRIPKKNIRNFLGKPIISYPIMLALESGIFSEIMVSTDDEEIKSVAEAYGASCPFMRSKEAASDHATTLDALLEVKEEYLKLGKSFDNICCLYPCSPLISKELLISAYEKFIESKADALTPVVRFSFPIQRASIIDEHGLLHFREEEYKNMRSQDLEPTYHDAGAFYFYRSSTLGKAGKTIAFELAERYVQDIDTLEDWHIAELKFNTLNKG